MSYEDGFDDLMPDTVTREAFAGQNDYGEPSFDAPVTVQCRVVRKPELVQRAGGEVSGGVAEVVSSARIYCSGSITFTWGLRDRITLPDGSQPPILQLMSYPDEDGVHHQMVLV